MSVHVSSLVYKAVLGGATRKIIALKLADCANDDGTRIFPAVGTIAAEVETSARTVQRTLRDFVDEGLLIEVAKGGKGPGSTAQYKFNMKTLRGLPGVKKADDEKDDIVSSSEEGKGDTDDAKGDTDDKKGDIACHPTRQEPSEPSSNPPTPKGAGPTPSDALKAFEAYNATALRSGLPQAAKLTPDRRRKIIARLREYGPDGWQTALGNLEKSAFLRGQTDKAFRADLDFVCQAKSFGRLHDGGYGNGAKAQASGPPPRRKPEWEMDAEMQEFARSQAQ